MPKMSEAQWEDPEKERREQEEIAKMPSLEKQIEAQAEALQELIELMMMGG